MVAAGCLAPGTLSAEPLLLQIAQQLLLRFVRHKMGRKLSNQLAEPVIAPLRLALQPGSMRYSYPTRSNLTARRKHLFEARHEWHEERVDVLQPLEVAGE